MRVDFYHLTSSSIESALPQLAEKIWASGKMAVIVSDDRELLRQIDESLWTARAESFVPHGFEGDDPIVLADAPPGEARPFLLYADGKWRAPAEGTERVFHFFDAETVADAREVWRSLAADEKTERHYWKQDGGKWVEGP